jgi:hypothetical protein
VLASVALGAVAWSTAEAEEPDAPLAQRGSEARAAAPGADPQTVPADTPPKPAEASAQPIPYAELGDNPMVRFWKYQVLEYGRSSAPQDPGAPPPPPAIREGWPAVPQTSPPMPFTDWPYGGTTLIGDNRTASVDSPLMVALAPTAFGKALSSVGIQIYGWVNYGGNISSSSQKAGNAPAAYDYMPNTVQLDQLVVYIERTPDTVQTDHIDWGFRWATLYGENYRYTTAYGVASYQLLKRNAFYGYDFPMAYVEVFIPGALQGLMLRFGRFISLPDIEAQLAPNNYMYTHSLTYSFDNYTNTGITASTAVTKNLILQAGLTDGTEAPLWHVGKTMTNLYPDTPSTPNPLYPDAKIKTDPGAQPTITLGLRYTWNDGNDNIQPTINGINRGQWGYNNLQWYGFTAYHKFNDHWHLSFEFYDEHQEGVPNAKNPLVQTIYANGGTPFSPQYIPFNAPALAQCKDATVLRCRATAIGVVAYLNYSPDPLNNFSFRPEYYADPQGQRTGVAADYWEFSVGWQHWLSPQIEMRPEIGYYRSMNAYAFNGNPTHGIAPNRNSTVIAAGDLIFHF